MRYAAWSLILASVGWVLADEQVPICYDYACQATAEIRYSEGQLGRVRGRLFAAADAAGEREALAQALGELYRWAGEQSEVHNDKGGNYADDGVSGRMDCIDHSTSTTRLLQLLERRGYLRWHRVLAPVERNVAAVLFIHYSAVIEEAASPSASASASASASTSANAAANAAAPLAGAAPSASADDPEAAGGTEKPPARFAVDSWFVDNGQPAVILPLEDWKKGAGPDV